ncbi:JAB domain-containing protein [Bdellovibrionota bacterium FG-2]
MNFTPAPPTESLSLSECLYALLGTEKLTRQLLKRLGADLPEAEKHRAFFQALDLSHDAILTDLPGLSDAAKTRLLCAFELSKRYLLFRSLRNHEQTQPSLEKGSLPNPQEALKRIPLFLRHSPKEWLGFVPQYSRRNLGEFCLVERGVKTHINIDPAELFARLLSLRPQAFYLFHNHPSGALAPSFEDQRLTEQVRQTAALFGIKLLGHAIIAASDAHFIQSQELPKLTLA